MKTKEEVIKEAWGDNYSKDVIMKGRRCGFKIITNMEYIATYKGGDWYCEPDTFETTAFMPTTLRQILKNNGWIKIECESDLPQDDYFGDLFEVGYLDNDGLFHQEKKRCSLKSIKWMFYQKLITHYQPIIKPKPPIY